MRIRRIVCALALPLFPVVLLIGTLVSPTDSTDNAVQLQAAAAHSSAWVAAALLELLAAAVLALAAAGVVLAVQERGVGVANAGGLCGVLGTLGMAAIAFRHMFIHGLATIDTAQALKTLDTVDATFGLPVLALMFLAPITFVVLAAAAVRAGIAALWVPFGAAAFLVVDMLPIPEAEIVQAVIGVATFGVLARGILVGKGAGRSALSPSPAVPVAP